jgi:hypothetical protein
MNQSEKDARIRAAGVVQSVIASGAPAEEWAIRAAYGLSLVSYMAGRLLKTEGLKAPTIPAQLKESK